jgi:signal transduction histidine kinase
MKASLILIILMYINSCVVAETDSLAYILDNIKNDTVCINTLNKLSIFHQKDNPQLSLKYALNAERIAKRCDYNKGLAIAFYTVGNIYADKKNNELAINSYKNCIDIYLKNSNKIGLSNTYNNLGEIYNSQHYYNTALDYFNKSLKINIEIQDSNKISNSYLQIGLIYTYQDKYDKALINFYKSLRIKEALNNKQGIANSYLNIGIIYFNIESYDQSIINLEQGLRLFENINNSEGIAESLLYLGRIYIIQKQYQRAANTLDASLNINKKRGNKKGMADAYLKIANIDMLIGNKSDALNNYDKSLKLYTAVNSYIGIINTRLELAKYYFSIKNLSEAKKQLDDILTLAKKHKLLKQELEISKLYAHIYMEQNRFEEASLMLLKSNTIADSLYNRNKIKERDRLKAKYEFDKNLYIKELNNIKQEAVDKLHIQKLKAIQYIVILFLILVTIIVFLILKKSIDIKKKNNILEAQQKQINQQLEELKYRKQALKQANSTKAKFLSMIGNDLRYSFNRINSFISPIIESDNETNPKKISKYIYLIKDAGLNAMSMLDNILEWAKYNNDSFTAHKQNVLINDLLRGNALLIKQQTQQKSINIIEELEGNPTVHIDINMINSVIRNLLSNALKFTNTGGEIWIKTVIKNDEVKVVIRDTGIGLTTEELDSLFEIDKKTTINLRSTRLGLILCREFLSHHRQELMVDSKIDFGTTFWFYLPIIST